MGPIILRILWKSGVRCARDIDCLVFSGFEITMSSGLFPKIHEMLSIVFSKYFDFKIWKQSPNLMIYSVYLYHMIIGVKI